MAQLHLFSVLVHNPPSSSDFIANDVIDSYWDDATLSIVVKKNGTLWSGSPGGYFGELNTNYYLSRATSFEGEYAVSGYSYCSDADLKWFRMGLSYPPYPYAELQTTVDSPVCDTGGGGVVCDIRFSGAPVITHAPDRTTGGSITVTAVSSNGTVKYGMRNASYASMTNTTGTFTSIIPGSWTIYAKDPNDCTAIINFKILYKPAELEHYRFTWGSKQVGEGVSRDERVRIYEREYVGSLVEVVNGATTPFSLFKPKQGEINDKFAPVHPTSSTLRLISEQDYQFLPLFTQDNKKYRCVYEVDEGSGYVPVWQGFIAPSVYREDFLASPYVVEIQIGDNVKTLEEELFTDDDGNLLSGSMKLIKIIALIMKKTGLSLKIRSGINIFEANHNTAATDDPLDQTYMDVACYREGADPFDCWRVLESILRPFGARIYQYDNQWIIEEIDRATASYAYRVFTSDGVYESNSTFDPVIDAKAPSEDNRTALIEQDHSLEVIPAYGKIDIVSKLNYIGSIVAGGFEQEDLLSPESEVPVYGQGVFKSEEGFRDWTLRMPPGISGVSFGRVVVSNRLDSSRTGLKTDEDDLTRSVGAFYFNPESWTGNLRDAYIESSAKPYEYGPEDELKLFFEYSTPARPEYEFMVLRVMLKVGAFYLQPDLTWDITEAVYRSYPAISNSLQQFELTVPAPETDVVVDSTIQVRIYYYASSFYDYGLPTSTGNPSDGTDGLAGLDTFVTLDSEIDHRVDIRREFTIFGLTFVYREFYELRGSDMGEDLEAGIIQAGDFHSTNNPRVWWRLKSINVKGEETNFRRRGMDLKFYIDNVALDALVNGQPPPEEDTISTTISKYINENLELELYNFDLPDIVNGKNMYNNYFRLSDGTPTALWARSGESESLSLQEILLSILKSNHSAPTFRVTGSFINEFARIGFNNYIRITKPGSSLVATNTEFTSNLNGWSQQFVDVSDVAYTWTADNSGSAQVILTGAFNSKQIFQPITHEGGYILFTVNIKAIPASSSNSAEDVLWALFFDGDDIIHTEKMQTFASVTTETNYEFTHTAFAPGHVSQIGFFIKRVSGTSSVTYQMSKFLPEGTDIQEVYQIADIDADMRNNRYFLELMQISKTYLTLGDIDKGGNSQGRTGGGGNAAFTIGFSLGLKS